MKKHGVWMAVGAYSIWGIFPLYWKLLHQVPAMQLLAHRIVWSMVCLLIVIVLQQQLKKVWRSFLSWRILGVYLAASLLIGVNWLTYVWAVNAGHIVETSLGYFINPLLSVSLGVLFFKEKLRWMQRLSLLITTAGVLYLTIIYGALPWIALVLASSFALYGFIKKIAPLPPLSGLFFETSLMLVPAVGFLLACNQAGTGVLFHSSITDSLLLIGAGVVTTIPLLMFVSAAQQIPLSMVGILQYIAPTLQFVIGVFVFKEPLHFNQLIGYSMVWFALIIFGVESYWHYRQS